jgi:hypothetical protein
MPRSNEQGIYDRGDQRFVTVKNELFRFLFLPWIKAGRGPVYWIVVCPADDHLAGLMGHGGGAVRPLFDWKQEARRNKARRTGGV